MKTISKKYMVRAKSILNFSIFLLAGALIGFVISLLLLDDDKSFNDELINTTFSYNYAVEKASPAVVNIYSEQIIDKQLPTQRRFNSIFNNKEQQVKTSLGSGVILSSDGYVLTNQHVVGDNSLRVTTELYDGRKFTAQLIGIDKGTDLAVLKIQENEILFPSIEIEDSDKVNIGDIVLAIGNPYGLGQSVSMGIVSATGREFDNPYSNYIQTDASDGPAYKSGLMKGDVINSINSESPSYDNLYKTFARSKPGEEILLKVKRGPDIINLSLITGQAD